MIYLTIVCVALVIGFVILLGLLLVLTSRERQTLLQRIQAPEVAVIAHQMERLPESPPAVPFDDDAAHHRARGFEPTREEMAEALR